MADSPISAHRIAVRQGSIENKRERERSLSLHLLDAFLQALPFPVSRHSNEFSGSRNEPGTLDDQRELQSLISLEGISILVFIKYSLRALREFTLTNGGKICSPEEVFYFARFLFINGNITVVKIIRDDTRCPIFAMSMFATMSIYNWHIFSCLVIEIKYVQSSKNRLKVYVCGYVCVLFITLSCLKTYIIQ